MPVAGHCRYPNCLSASVAAPQRPVHPCPRTARLTEVEYMSHPMLCRRTLAAALIALSTAAIVLPAAAQEEEDTYKSKSTTSNSGGAAGASERARMKREQKVREEAAPPLFPLASRVEPKAESSKAGVKLLKGMIASFDAHDFASVQAQLNTVLAEPTINTYDKSFAFQVAANAAGDAKQHPQAIEFFKKAIDANGLDNNGHYQVMYNLAVEQYQASLPADSLATLERFFTETKTQTPEQLGLKAGLLSQLKRPAEAAAVYEALLVANPNDKKILMNVVALYQQSGQQAKANALLASAASRGLMTAPSEYRAIYVPAITAGKLEEAVKLIDEGVAKGLVKPSPELARDYAFIGQSAYAQKKTAFAIDMFRRAAPMAANGEVWLNLARVYSNEKKFAEAKDAARHAIAQGLAKPDDAKKILALPGK